MENIERLKYKTRGEQIPQGIPKVFYCCHPKDFDRFFESVSDEILAKQNCAVFYDSTPDAERDEQFFLDLKRMQLFVMPVTSELLYIENTALSELFPFAIENHIPVLPIMQEKGLDKAFNEKCGDLQYLDKTSTDITAISYDEKLDKYLSSVLIGDEMAEKIRNAFDAYVFLSYRKKDRKYAQELMRLIHKNDFCRDIAIWYDEFLTPGEDFNNAIEAALKKSGLFVLAVTPNLVNEDNYVMTTEYPKARDAGKLILPAELVETDKNLLAEKYEGIPECTDAYNDEMLSSALLESVKNIALKENDKNPEHNFFIGLAYLGGVDVEVDHEKAVELITFAAENNVVEAIDKLVEMYRTGHGVERDYLEAIKWQEKLIEIFEDNYQKEQIEKNHNALFGRIIICGDYYKELGKLNEANGKYEQAQSLFDGLVFDYLTNKQKRNYALSYERIGDIFKAEGKLSQARKCYEECFEIRHKLSAVTESGELNNDLSSSYSNLGDLCKEEGNLEDARMYYEEFLKISLSIAKESDTVLAKRNLILSYLDLGDICREEDKNEQAKAHFQNGFEKACVLAKSENTNEINKILSICYNRLGDMCLAEKDYSEARCNYEEALKIRSDIAERTDTLEAQRDIALCYYNFGNSFSNEENFEKAREYYKKGMEIILYLNEMTDTFECKRDLFLSYLNFGDTFESEGQRNESSESIEKANNYYFQMLDIAFDLAEKTDIVDAKRDLAISYRKIGRIHKLKGELSKAKDYYEKALNVTIDIVKNTNRLACKKDLAFNYALLGDMFLSEKEFGKACGYFEESANLRLDIFNRTNSVVNKKALLNIYNRLVYAYNLNDQVEQEKRCCKKSIKLAEDILKEESSVEVLKKLSFSYWVFGDICRKENNLPNAKANYEKSIKIYFDIVEETGIKEKYDLLQKCAWFSKFCEAERDLNRVRFYNEKLIEISLLIAEETKTAEHYDNVAMAYYKASFYNEDKKEVYLKNAVEMYEMLAKDYPDIERFKEFSGRIKAEYEEICEKALSYKTQAANESVEKKSFFENIKSKFRKNKS